MSDTSKAFWEHKNTAFIAPEPAMDFLHPESRESEPAPELTETQYLGFNIPEHDIHALCYLWHHPNLGVCSGGVWAWQGIKTQTLACELFDMQIYFDDAVLADDLHGYELPNGYKAQVVKPMHKLHIEYADDARGNRFDLAFEAIMPAMVQAAGLHFEQAMHVTGSLTLAGTKYAVDGHTVRDRSWGAVRRETSMPLPPMDWMTGVFGDDLIFGCTAFDSEDLLPLPGGDPLRGGWIRRDGVLVPITAVTKRVHRNAQTLFPERVEMVITGEDGHTMDLTGTITAAAPWAGWHNMNTIICLTRWECDGRVGWGDTQDVLFGDYYRRFLEASAAAAA